MMADMIYKTLVLAMLAIITVCAVKLATDGTMIEIVVKETKARAGLYPEPTEGWEI